MGSLVPMTSLAPFPLPEPLPPASTARTVYGPASPYDPNTEHGRIFIKRRDSDMYPLAVDKWLQANQCLWHRDDPRLASTHILSDVVECKVKVLFSPDILHPDYFNPFLDDPAHHKLILTAKLAATSITPSRWHQSPPAILDLSYEESLHGFGPDWWNMFEVGKTEVTFGQPRSLICALFAKLALETENIERGYAEPMLRWADAVSPVKEARKALKRSGKQSFRTEMGRDMGKRPRLIPYKLRPRNKQGRFAPGLKRKLQLRPSVRTIPTRRQG